MSEIYKKLYDKLYEADYNLANWSGYEYSSHVYAFHMEGNKKIEYGLILHLDKLGINYQTVLDAGCAFGNSLIFLRTRKKDVKGIDISELAVKKALTRGLDVKCGSITAIPFENNSFDLTISTDVLEHLLPEDTKKAISELCRVSSKYVAVQISTVKEKSSLDILAKIQEAKDEELLKIDNLHMSVFSKTEWLSFFLEHKVKLLYEHNTQYNCILILEKV